VSDAKWSLVDKVQVKNENIQKISSLVPAKGSVKKCKHNKIEETELHKAKKSKPALHPVIGSQGPCGMLWDSINFSCAYDSLFTILHSIWSNDPRHWNNFFQNANQYLSVLSNGFDKHLHERVTLEDV